LGSPHCFGHASADAAVEQGGADLMLGGLTLGDASHEEFRQNLKQRAFTSVRRRP
jgi:hypothetical protein